MRVFLRSKIHNAMVTEANINYVGSITIDESLMLKVGMDEYERVLVVDNTNGNRLETYVIKGPKDSGVICMNGAAARLINQGDQIIIMAFHLVTDPVKPTMILVDQHNQFVRYLDPDTSHLQLIAEFN